jgi:DNA-directed RNA polymerase subunit F
MKTYIPTISLVASLVFACTNSLAQVPAPAPRAGTPAPPAVPVVATVPAQEEADAFAATEDALAAQEKALEAQNEALEKVNEKLWKIGPRAARAGAATRSLVIPKDSADVKSLTETEEDMSVMARILEKAANDKGRKSQPEAMGIGVFGTSGSGSPRNLYIDGFGALFFLNVNYPLLPPTTKEQAPESKTETDSEWEKTKNELYRPQSTGADLSFNFTPFDSGTYVYTTGGPAEEYDEDKVTELKENLTAALKNASHIRRLKGDDTVTVIVTGRNPGSSTKVTARRSQNGSSSSSSSSSWSTSRSGSQPPAARLIIRAKRSDIESFQKDKLSADDFRKKVTMFIY